MVIDCIRVHPSVGSQEDSEWGLEYNSILL